MNQEKTTTQKLTAAEIKQIKGGFREVRGAINSSLSVRWDEIIIRIHDRDNSTRGMDVTPATDSPGAGSQSIMP